MSTCVPSPNAWRSLFILALYVIHGSHPFKAILRLRAFRVASGEAPHTPFVGRTRDLGFIDLAPGRVEVFGRSLALSNTRCLTRRQRIHVTHCWIILLKIVDFCTFSRFYKFYLLFTCGFSVIEKMELRNFI